MRKLLGALLLLSTLQSAALIAAERNDLGSCYDKANLSEYKPTPSGRQLVIVIDQTVRMPEDLQRSAWDSITRFIQPGDQVKLYSFSAFVPGEYIRLLTDITLDKPISEKIRNTVSRTRLRTLDSCLKQQQQQFIAVVGGQFVNALRSASEELPRSEIMHALREIGHDMQRQTAQERIVFLISDMLENSDYTSFYANNRIRDLNLDRELQLADKQALYANLQGARVYVSGAGVVTSNIKHSYRSSKTMDKLNQFWDEYFKRSEAQLEGFGMPMLNMELR
ncbi:hypothetical protein [Balneatrix alpica]|uniref:hypothetical protein n=1 Tax=Balneatrix alpica TaxID=75684 RepID=UPI00273985D2|nr:hypothetical protein [Balneatrix alpica]